jgi:hypothetical protein
MLDLIRGLNVEKRIQALLGAATNRGIGLYDMGLELCQAVAEVVQTCLIHRLQLFKDIWRLGIPLTLSIFDGRRGIRNLIRRSFAAFLL